MFCNNCGSQIPDNSAFCPACGNTLAQPNANPDPAPQYQQPQYQAPQYQAPQYQQPQYQAPQYQQPQYQPYPQQPQYQQPWGEPKPQVGFGEAIKLFFSNYANFSGRSRRSEYWYATLFNFLMSLIIGSIPYVGTIWALVVFIPSLAVCARRLHDIGKSGWWYLLNFIPLVGSIILIVWFCKDSTEANQWGPNPKY